MTPKRDSYIEDLVEKIELFDFKTPISKMKDSIERNGAAVLLKDGDYYGVVDTRALYRSGIVHDLKSAAASNFSVKVPWITKNTPLDSLVQDFYKSRARVLPYLAGKKVKGVLKRYTLLKMLLSTGALKSITVGESMTTPIVSIGLDTNVAQATSAMRENKVNRLVVLSNGRFAGIVTNHDIMAKYSKGDERRPEFKDSKYRLSNAPLSDIIEKNVETINESSGLSDAARAMVEREISSLVAVRGGTPVGILTVRGILESVMVRKRIEPQRIFLSGLDSLDYDYESEVREELSTLIDWVDKAKNLRVEYITLHVKRIKTKSYEINVRISLDGRGIMNMTSEGYIFEDTLATLLDKAKTDLLKIRSKDITRRRYDKS